MYQIHAAREASHPQAGANPNAHAASCQAAEAAEIPLPNAGGSATMRDFPANEGLERRLWRLWLLASD